MEAPTRSGGKGEVTKVASNCSFPPPHPSSGPPGLSPPVLLGVGSGCPLANQQKPFSHDWDPIGPAMSNMRTCCVDANVLLCVYRIRAVRVFSHHGITIVVGCMKPSPFESAGVIFKLVYRVSLGFCLLVVSVVNCSKVK